MKKHAPAPVEAVAPLPVEPAANIDSRVAKAFIFGTEASRPMSALPALDRMSERMAKRIRDLIGPFARSKPRVTPQAVAIRRYESWLDDQPEFTSLSIYRFRPLKGGMLIAIEPRFVTQLVDAFYGGSGGTANGKAREFTATEEQLLLRLSETIISVVTEVWSEVIAVQPQLTSRETNTAYASLVRPEEPVAIARFSIVLGEGAPTAMDIVYPVSSLRAVEDELTAKLGNDPGGTAGEWRERLAAALSDVRVEARSVLARPTMQMSQLMTLAPGDIIPISVPATVPLIVAGRMLAQGTIGEHDGRAALKIERVANRSPNS